MDTKTESIKPGQAKALRDKIKQAAANGRQNFERGWFRNILFYAGFQWISFSNTSKRWEKWKPSGGNKDIPQPVTNKFAIAVDTIKSVITQRNPRITIVPETDDEDSIATAEIGEDLNEVLDKEAGMTEVRKTSAGWGVITGNCFAYTYYDTSPEHGMTSIDIERCNACGSISNPQEIEDGEGNCPRCGMNDFGAAINPDGTKQEMSFPKGKLTTEVRAPFEVFFDNEIGDFYKARQVVLSKSKTVEELRKQYPKFKDKIVPTAGAADKISEYYMTSISYITSTSSSGMAPSAADGGNKIEKALVDEVFSLPTDEFPNGLYAVVIGEIEVESGELWSQDINGNYYLPIAKFGGLEIPGRAWNKAPVDDLVTKQIQRNKYESMIELSLLRMGSPDWLIPDGSGVDDITGEPGQKITYKPSISGVEPKRLPGMPVNASLFQFMEMIDKEIEDLAATYDALRGDTPSGLKAFSALKLLTERGFSRHIEIIHNWEDYHKRIKIHQLEIARQHFTEPRKRTISNKNGVWETKEFTKADLQGAVSVEVESGSAVPKSQAAEQAQLMELQGAGILDLSDPRIHYKFMERMGQADMMNGVDEDVKDASREWKDFVDSIPEYEQKKKEGDPHPEAYLELRFRPNIDNNAIHYLDHVSKAKSPEFFALPPDVQDAWVQHLEMHKQEQQIQAMQNAAPAGPPQAPGIPGRPSMAAQARGDRSRAATLETKQPAPV